MTERHDPFPLWRENATKGDLLLAVEYLRGMVIDLAGVIVSIRANDEEGAQQRMKDYFVSDKKFAEVMDVIGGKVADGK
ncbi:MAG: hypothetical protein ABIM50_04350 [Novosphingobium sp.]